jgi:hypothetical protein
MKENIMKKMLIAGAAALALLMSACMLFDQGEPEPEFDKYGNRLITLTIFTGDNSRNMTIDTGMVGINYYEVVFSDGVAAPATAYYRAAGPRGKTLTIRLPVGFDLLGPTHAIVFGGAWAKQTDERKLLATGIITHQNYATGTPLAIAGNNLVTANTQDIRFELAPLDTRFDTSGDSSFKITGTDNHIYIPKGFTTVLDYATNGGVTATSANRLRTPVPQLPHKLDRDTGDLYPYFRLPKAIDKTGSTAATATATFSFGLATTHLPGIHTSIDANFEFDSYAIFTGYSEDGLTAVKAVPVAPFAPPQNDAAIPALIPINIAMRSEPLNEGFCMLVISLQVKAISTTNGDGDWWTLSNGMFDYEIHDNNKVTGVSDPLSEGTTFAGGNGAGYSYGASLGGAIMLCIGEPESSTTSRPIRIIISPLVEP